ncbi:MAG: hypothetical protein ACREQY_15595 [Candidatus Binatia bacterium]
MSRGSAEGRGSPTSPIVGGDFRRREDLRPALPIEDLEDFLSFLDELEEVFGPIPKPPRVNRATRFVL